MNIYFSPETEVKTSDSSIYKFITNGSPFDNPAYTPQNLVNITWDKIRDVLLEEGLRSTPQQIREEVLEPLRQLWIGFVEALPHHEQLFIQSSFRPYERQEELYNNAPDNKKQFVAEPWCSEHQTGLAVDVVNGQSHRIREYEREYDWIKKHAHRYGFHVSFQKWIEIDGIPVEPWHIRYFGTEFATYLYQQGITFTQYMNGEGEEFRECPRYL